MLAVSALMQVEVLSPAPRFLAKLILLAVAWTGSCTRNFAQAEGAAKLRLSRHWLALFLAGFTTAASNPITITYLAAALVPIG